MSLLRPLLRPTLLTTPLLLSAAASPLLLRPRPILCETAYASTNAPVLQAREFASKNKPNPKIVRQISMGSIFGIVSGLGVSLLSKPLAVILGLGFLGVQFLETRGIHIIPYSFLQRRFKNVNWKALLAQDIAFKLSFGVTFTLAAFSGF